MTKWDYRGAYVDFRGRVSVEGQEMLIEKGERRSAFVRTVLDHLGKDGWELAGVHPLWPAETSYMVFKRQAEGGSTGEVAGDESATGAAESKGKGEGEAGEPTRAIGDDATEMV
jgi:hypothetical protein